MRTRRAWLASLLALSCKRNSRPDQSHLKKIAADAGIQFPPTAELLFEEASGGLNLWIIHAYESFSLPGERLMVGPGPVRAEIEKHIQTIGELADPMAARWSWENAAGRWRASSVRGASGYFLHLERFAQP